MVKKLASLLCGVCCLLLASCAASPEKVREKIDFNDGWRFLLGDEPQAEEVGFADTAWRALDLPHDWAIEGDFSQDNPSGTGGGALPGGIGWYRKTFVPDKADADKKSRIVFDGGYMNSEVFLNGLSMGHRPYGYITFS